MTDNPQAEAPTRKGRHRFVVNVGSDMDRWLTIEADDYEVAPEGLHFVREIPGAQDGDPTMSTAAFVSHPCMVRDKADVADGDE